jgi:hypothetical protein
MMVNGQWSTKPMLSQQQWMLLPTSLLQRDTQPEMAAAAAAVLQEVSAVSHSRRM